MWERVVLDRYQCARTVTVIVVTVIVVADYQSYDPNALGLALRAQGFGFSRVVGMEVSNLGFEV